jgi:hypothetical protein
MSANAACFTRHDDVGVYQSAMKDWTAYNHKRVDHALGRTDCSRITQVARCAETG